MRRDGHTMPIRLSLGASEEAPRLDRTYLSVLNCDDQENASARRNTMMCVRCMGMTLNVKFTG